MRNRVACFPLERNAGTVRFAFRADVSFREIRGSGFCAEDVSRGAGPRRVTTAARVKFRAGTAAIDAVADAAVAAHSGRRCAHAPTTPPGCTPRARRASPVKGFCKIYGRVLHPGNSTNSFNNHGTRGLRWIRGLQFETRRWLMVLMDDRCRWGIPRCFSWGISTDEDYFH